MVRIPAGKYKGRDIRTLLSGQLARMRITEKDPRVLDLINLEWERRFHFPLPDKWVDELSEESKDDVRLIVETGYRQLVLKLHPDQGGDNEKMVKLTKAMAELRRLLGL